jgi:hypothetical protein
MPDTEWDAFFSIQGFRVEVESGQTAEPGRKGKRYSR